MAAPLDVPIEGRSRSAHALDREHRFRGVEVTGRTASPAEPLEVVVSANGRAIVGIGAGHVEGEFDALGVSFARRGELTDRALATTSASAPEGPRV